MQNLGSQWWAANGAARFERTDARWTDRNGLGRGFRLTGPVEVDNAEFQCGRGGLLGMRCRTRVCHLVAGSLRCEDPAVVNRCEVFGNPGVVQMTPPAHLVHL